MWPIQTDFRASPLCYIIMLCMRVYMSVHLYVEGSGSKKGSVIMYQDDCTEDEDIASLSFFL